MIPSKLYIRHFLLIIISFVFVQLAYPQAFSSPPDSTNQDAASQDKKSARERIEELINSIDYGVPSSPAFELLPDKPSEVVHILTGRDIQTSIINIIDGSRLRGGFALDLRPFVWFSGSLERYNRNLLSRIAWRSVFSVGSAVDPEKDSDLLLGAGFRIPLIDKGDPRTRLDHLKELEKAYEDLFSVQSGAVQPPFEETIEQFNRKIASAATKADSIRKDWEANTWNALKVDLGLAGMLRARSRSMSEDSLKGERIGFWAGAGFPLKRLGQLSISGKLSWSKAESIRLESARHSLGTRVRFFLTKSIAASIEGAEVWTRHKKEVSNLDDAWFHFAILTELKLPIIGGWIGIAYGGDAGKSGDSDAKFSINYAYYMNRLTSK